MKYYITGTRRGLGKALELKYGNCNNLDDCDIFINCKHDGFTQVDLLYKAADLKKRIVNIGSIGNEWISYKHRYIYGIEKKALKNANDQLYYEGVRTSIINFGFINTESVEHIDKPKIDIKYAVDIIDWVLNQPYIIKDITFMAQK